MKVRVVEVSDAAWIEVLSQLPHDIYHLASYCSLYAADLGGRPVLLTGTSDLGIVALPLIVRPLPAIRGSWHSDAVSPYGYSGILSSAQNSNDVAREFLAAASALLAELGIVSVFVRTHPLLSPTIAAGESGRACWVSVANGQTVVLDPRLSDTERAAGMRSVLVRDIKKLRADGFYVEQDRWDQLEEFASVYRETMARVGASEGYFYSPSFFSDFRAALGERLHLFVARAPSGELAAASLFSRTGEIVQYLYSGTAGAFSKRGASKLVLDAAIGWAGGQGAHSFHLGGGVGGQADSLFAFKAGFSDRRCEFSTLRWIIDTAGYESIAGEPVAADALSAGFFPRYRAPKAVATDDGSDESTRA